MAVGRGQWPVRSSWAGARKRQSSTQLTMADVEAGGVASGGPVEVWGLTDSESETEVEDVTSADREEMQSETPEKTAPGPDDCDVPKAYREDTRAGSPEKTEHVPETAPKPEVCGGPKAARVETWEVHLPDTEPKAEAVDVEGPGQVETWAESPEKMEAKVEQPPILLCKLIVRSPKAAFVIALSIYILAFLISGVLIITGYDLFPVEFTNVPLNQYHDPALQRYYAWMYRHDQDKDLITRVPTSMFIKGNRTIMADSLDLIFETKDGSNIFTAAHLKAIQKVQKEIQAVPKYASYCMMSSGSCATPVSPINYFDGTYASENPAWNDPDFKAISTALYAAYTNANHSSEVRFFLGKTAKVGPSLVSSPITRIRIRFGLPLESGGTEEEQIDELKAFLTKDPSNVVQKYFNNPPAGLEMVYYSRLFYSSEVVAQAIKDMALAGGSFLFIFIFVCIQTQSAWIGGWTIFSILGAFVITNLIYRCIIGFRYFGFFHVLSIFIILGIGADDVFIFVDTWRDSAHQSFPSLEHRFSYAYRRAAVAMAVTSATTMAAFLVSATSPLIAINSFGVFSAILVFVDYIGVITFFPTALMLHHQHVQYWCCGAKREVPSRTNSVAPNAEAGKAGTKEEKNIFVRFFRGPFFDFVTHKIARWIILAFFAVLLAVSIYFISLLRPTDEAVKIYNENHNFAKADAHGLYSFLPSSSDVLVKVVLTWGLGLQDMNSCHFSNITCHGKTVHDSAFDLSSAEAQLGLARLCHLLEAPSTQLSDRLSLYRSPLTNATGTKCFLTPFEAYLAKHGMSLPLNETNVRPFMLARTVIYGNPATWPSNFSRYFEVMVMSWMTNGYTYRLSKEYLDYSSLVGEAMSAGTRNVSMPLPLSAVWGSTLRWVGIEANLTLNRRTLGYPQGLPVAEEWEKFMEEQRAMLPTVLRKGFQTSSAWPWLLTQKLLVESALYGLGIGIGLALLILTITTCNIVVALVATLCIAGITTCVVAVISMAGWKLGVLESINMSLVVGLAVDYVVHFAEAYNHSHHTDRRQRTRDALELVGVSVLSGATTTLGAALFMLFAQILFFVQFGIFLFCTILFSFVFALGFFCTFMALCGPEGNTGNFLTLCKGK